MAVGPASVRSRGAETSTRTSLPSTTTAVDRHRLCRRQADRLAGAQIEARPVKVALDLAIANVSLRQRDLGVRALVVDRVEVPIAVHDGQLDPAAVLRHLDRNGRLRRHVVDGAHANQRAHDGSPMLIASSASTASSSRFSISGTPTLRMISAKNPCTTRRRASASSIPRLRR